MELAQDRRPPPSEELDVRGVEPTDFFQELIKKIVLGEQRVRNENTWNGLGSCSLLDCLLMLYPFPF